MTMVSAMPDNQEKDNDALLGNRISFIQIISMAVSIVQNDSWP
jgi:hypothetical protein